MTWEERPRTLRSAPEPDPQKQQKCRYAAASSEQIGKVYRELIAEISAGTLRADVEATYPLSDVQAALEHSTRSGRAGKVVLTGPAL